MATLHRFSHALWRAAWLPVLGLAAVAAVACDRGAWPRSPEADAGAEAAGSAPQRVRVAYPRGGCATGQLEIQIHRDGRWLPHPKHPTVAAGGVRWENADELLSLRVRCIDPTRQRAPSAWVLGVRVSGGADGSGASAEAGP